MADMCGPSNALQNFQKHSTLDRTLQQDRLVGRQSPAQGFRSSPATNSGLLENEFQAFQAGQLPLDHGFQPQGSFSHAPPPSLQQSDPSNWASDFQRMNISSPQPQLQHHPFGRQTQQRQESGAWHQEFARQNQGVEQNIGQTPYQRYTPMSGMMGNQFGGFAGPQTEMSIAQQKQPEAFNEEAFARAFEEAANAQASRLEAETEIIQDTAQGVEIGQDVMIEESIEQSMDESALLDQQGVLLDQQRIGADSIFDPAIEEVNQPSQEDADALARTAGHLLNSIRHEQSSKFQNSQFLELMRQFRDGQMVVEGDKVVDTHEVFETGNEEMHAPPV